MDVVERRTLSRLVHRFSFGPKPGDFESYLSAGFSKSVDRIISNATPDNYDVRNLLGINYLGIQPAQKTAELTAYQAQKRNQMSTLTIWWLDQMVLQQHSITERMAWFWHGHWSTSNSKVDDPMLMANHLTTLRNMSVGNFSEMARLMVMDGALVLWLDGQRNTKNAPNENLSRELMELFLLGVNRYTEIDVKQIAKALTGYGIDPSSGTVIRDSKKSYLDPVTFLGMTGKYDAESLALELVKTSSCERFIPERLWFRFVSTDTPLPQNHVSETQFKNREVLQAVRALITSDEFIYGNFPQVKSPLEWLVGILRAGNITPSLSPNPASLVELLNSLGQRPFYPPTVGGWPADDAWLTTASMMLRIQAAQNIMKYADLAPISKLNVKSRVEGMAKWLGISVWSERTKAAFATALRDPVRLAVLGVCSPEYLVNA